MSEGKMQKVIWLEISNARIEGTPTQKLQAQFKADKSDKEPTWWDVVVPDVTKVESTYRLLVEAIDKKRLVLGELGVNGQELHIANYRIQFTEVSR